MHARTRVCARAHPPPPHTHTHQCSKLPVAWSPLATNFSRWRQPTCDLVAKKKKKKKKKKKNRAVANLSQRRRADRERAIFLAFFRFGLIENETRIAKLPPVTRMRGATEQYSAEPAQKLGHKRAAGAFHTCAYL